MNKFKHAFDGLKIAIKEKSIMIQIILGIFAIIGGFVINLDAYEWLAFTICIVGVISLEIINSAVEKLCDLYSMEYNEKIKAIKDLTSAAVLMFCFGAFAVCIICLIRRFV